MHEEVFNKLEFTKPLVGSCCTSKLVSAHSNIELSTHRLVEEFEYDIHTGDIFYDVSVERDGKSVQYARLLTINSWYNHLFTVMVLTVLMVMDLYTNFDLCMDLVLPAGADVLMKELQEIAGILSVPFVVGWSIMVGFQIIFSVNTALKDWKIKSNPRVGDIITHVGFFDRFYTFLAMIFFAFFDIDASVRDLPVRLHPWKSVQPFCAFKADGHRAYAIGYESEEMFRVEDHEAFGKMVFQLLMNTLVFAMKTWMLGQKLAKGDISMLLIQSCVTSLPSLCLAWRKWWCLWHDRRKLHQTLTRTIQKSERQPKNLQSEHMLRKVEVARRMVDRFFGSTFARASEAVCIDSPKCLNCDRMCVPKGPVFPTPPKVLPIKGQHVQLAEDFESFHDAKHSSHILKPGQRGVIVEVGPFLKNVGMRCLVRPLIQDGICGEKAGVNTWWYDLGSLNLLESFDDSDSLSQQLTSTPEDIQAQAFSLPGTPDV